MNAERFCYWLQGFFELGEVNNLTFNQIEMIKEHLDKALVAENVKKEPEAVKPQVLPVSAKFEMKENEGLDITGLDMERIKAVTKGMFESRKTKVDHEVGLLDSLKMISPAKTHRSC